LPAAGHDLSLGNQNDKNRRNDKNDTIHLNGLKNVISAAELVRYFQGFAMLEILERE
jgi:hypothetical protein